MICLAVVEDLPIDPNLVQDVISENITIPNRKNRKSYDACSNMNTDAAPVSCNGGVDAVTPVFLVPNNLI